MKRTDGTIIRTTLLSTAYNQVALVRLIQLFVHFVNGNEHKNKRRFYGLQAFRDFFTLDNFSVPLIKLKGSVTYIDDISIQAVNKTQIFINFVFFKSFYGILNLKPNQIEHNSSLLPLNHRAM